jgi:hypothetical protein
MGADRQRIGDADAEQQERLASHRRGDGGPEADDGCEIVDGAGAGTPVGPEIQGPKFSKCHGDRHLEALERADCDAVEGTRARAVSSGRTDDSDGHRLSVRFGLHAFGAFMPKKYGPSNVPT